MRTPRPMNNPQAPKNFHEENRRRAHQTGQRHAEQARDALARLQGGILYGHWEAVLRHRADNPTASLRELAETMTPPITKNAYAALLRRALRAAEDLP